MDRVLLDGSTLVFAARLLDGEEPPNAVSLFDLALLVESLILHDSVLILDTRGDDELRSYAARHGGEALTVQHHAVRELVDAYVALEVPEVRTLDRADPRQKEAVKAAEGKLRALLDRKYRGDDQIRVCLALLSDAERAISARRSEKEREKELRRFRQEHRVLGTLHKARVPVAHGIVDFVVGAGRRSNVSAEQLTADRAMREAWEDFVERYTDRAERSPWHEQKMYRHAWLKTGDYILIRAHFYLLASEVLGAPYRPDAFRAPICWKFFGKSRLSDFTLEERLVEAAERFARDRIDSLNAFLDRPAFVALPLFLARVLAESSDRSQVVPIALQIRDSRPARRFREYAARLRVAVEEGEVAEVARELDRYARLLRDEFGRHDDGAEVLWSLAASGAKAAVLQDPASITGLATEAGTRGGNAAARWWSNRKLALIAKTIKQSQRARGFQPEVRRLFGAELPESELELLQDLATLAPAATKASSANGS
jgi:hypothetical protein